MHLRNLLMILHVQYDLTLLPTPQNLRSRPRTTLTIHRAAARLLPLAPGTMLADLGMTMLLGTIPPTAAEIADPHTMTTILATSTMKADLVLDIRPTTPNLVGEFFTLEEYQNKYRLFYVGDPVSLVALPDYFGVTMLLPTFGTAATSSSKGL